MRAIRGSETGVRSLRRPPSRPSNRSNPPTAAKDTYNTFKTEAPPTTSQRPSSQISYATETTAGRLLRSIHPSAWKASSAKFAFMGFS
jgi:hypothetical protein